MNKYLKIAVGFSLVIISLAFVTNIIFAQTPGGQTNQCPPGQAVGSNGKCQIVNPASGQFVNLGKFEDVLPKVVNFLLGIAGVIAVIFLIYGGFQYVVSRGNETATEKAKKTIIAAIIGLVIIVMAFAIVNIVNNLLTKPSDQNLQGNSSGQNNNPNSPGNNNNNTQTLSIFLTNANGQYACARNTYCNFQVANIIGGVAPYYVTKDTNNPGPSGLAIITTADIISMNGSSSQPGSYPIGIRVKDSSNPQLQTRVDVTVVIN